METTPILTIPDKRLFTKSERVTDFGPETKKIVRDLLGSLHKAADPEGAGLAAPQIGALKRIAVVRNFLENPDGSDKSLIQEFVLINPKIFGESRETFIDWEGCLSVPDTYGRVERFKKIKVQAQNENGENIRLSASGLFAAVIQHEVDHLDGILFTSKVIGTTVNGKELDQIYAGVANS
jgi:peptide deformylase